MTISGVLIILLKLYLTFMAINWSINTIRYIKGPAGKFRISRNYAAFFSSAAILAWTFL